MGSPPRILTIIGTRPEAIKLFPLVHALRGDTRLVSRVCSTGQHGDLLEPVLALAGIAPDHRLETMRAGQSLDALTARLIEGIGGVLDRERPDAVIVQGDTTSAFAGALAAHYRRIPVAHVEAGLRSANLHHPWPEEFNRKAIAALAHWHFAPTRHAHEALLAENVAPGSIHRVGNTVVDALLWMQARLRAEPWLAGRIAAIEETCQGRRIIAVTCHRRENLDDGIDRIAAALAILAKRGDVSLVLPLHPNPGARDPLVRAMQGCETVHFTGPLEYPDFVRLLERAHLVLTDSGGVQEEAPAFGTPVLVMRKTTERAEGIEAGTARLVGTDTDRIVAEAGRLLDDARTHAVMARAHNPYGDGKASGRIVDVLAGDFV